MRSLPLLGVVAAVGIAGADLAAPAGLLRAAVDPGTWRRDQSRIGPGPAAPACQ